MSHIFAENALEKTKENAWLCLTRNYFFKKHYLLQTVRSCETLFFDMHSTANLLSFPIKQHFTNCCRRILTFSFKWEKIVGKSMILVDFCGQFAAF